MGKFVKWIVGILVFIIIMVLGGGLLLAIGGGALAFFITYRIAKGASNGPTSSLNYM